MYRSWATTAIMTSIIQRVCQQTCIMLLLWWWQILPTWCVCWLPAAACLLKAALCVDAE